MPDYSLGKIYKIICLETGLVYIGSTCEPTLARRLATHRADYKLYLNGKKNYITSFKVLENEVFEIVLIENCLCNSKDELHKQERFFIENNVCVNKHIPGRTVEEYYEANKNAILDNKKVYYIKNRIRIIERVRLRHLRNKIKTIEELI